MQTPPNPSTSIAQYALYALAAPLLLGAWSLITLFVNHLLNRGEIRPKIDAITAGAEKNRAEAREKDGNVIKDAWERIDQQQEVIDELRAALLMADDEKHRMARVIEDRDLKIKLQETQLSDRTSINPGQPPFKE